MCVYVCVYSGGLEFEMGVCLWVKKSLVARVWIGIRRSIIRGGGKRGANDVGRTRCTVRRWCSVLVGKARRAGTYIHIRD